MNALMPVQSECPMLIRLADVLSINDIVASLVCAEPFRLCTACGRKPHGFLSKRTNCIITRTATRFLPVALSWCSLRCVTKWRFLI